jgi:hypothetical protein
MEVVEWFLFHRVDGQCTGLGIDLADKHATVVASAAADAGLSVGYVTVMRTKLTLYCPTLQLLIISTFLRSH